MGKNPSNFSSETGKRTIVEKKRGNFKTIPCRGNAEEEQEKEKTLM